MGAIVYPRRVAPVVMVSLVQPSLVGGIQVFAYVSEEVARAINTVTHPCHWPRL